MKLTSGPTTEALTQFDVLQQLQTREAICYNSSLDPIITGASVELDPGASRQDGVRNAQADSPTFVGVAAEDIEPGGFGRVIISGVLHVATEEPVRSGQAVYISVDPTVGERLTTGVAETMGVLIDRGDEVNIWGRIVKVVPDEYVLVQIRGIWA